MRKHLHWAPGSTPVQAAKTAYLLCPHNGCTIEDDAQGRGRKGKSSERRHARIEHLLRNLETLVSSNPDMSSMPPEQVAQLAVEKAVKESPELWSQGKNQLDQYLTELASDPAYKRRYYALFDETG